MEKNINYVNYPGLLVRNSFPRDENYVSNLKDSSYDYNEFDLQKLNDLLISSIIETSQNCGVKRRITNSVIKQIQNGVTRIVIHVGSNQIGSTILKLLEQIPSSFQQHILRNIILNEFGLDLSNTKIEVCE